MAPTVAMERGLTPPVSLPLAPPAPTRFSVVCWGRTQDTALVPSCPLISR